MSNTLATPTTATPQPQWLLDLNAGRDQYVHALDWPVAVEAEQRRLVVAVGARVDAVVMPLALGQRVHAALQIATVAAPVIAGPGRGWWTFITEPSAVQKPDVPGELHAMRVRVVPRGSTVVLPCGITCESSPRWVIAPRSDRPLPPWPAVVNAARRLVHYLGSDSCGPEPAASTQSPPTDSADSQCGVAS